MTDKREKDLLMELLQERASNGKTRRDYDSDVYEIDLLAFFHLLRRKILIIILAAVVGAALLGAYSLFVATPMYQSTAKVYVVSQSASIPSLADIQLSSELALDYQEMIYSYPVVKQVINNLGLDYKYKQITESMLNVENPADTRVIKVTITAPDPEEAAAMANEFAKVAKRTIADIMESDEPKIFEHGRAIADPVSPDKTRNVALGFIGGAFIAILVLLIMFITRDTIKTPEDIEKRLGGNVLATVPFEKVSKDGDTRKSKRRGKSKGRVSQ
ncbi:MAG: Wzz/FepE/Etk N-terminal domain-containing protein [Eubacteriales bacterium]|nr:Wzz/FepE/Etk N-terminal domain-containing protein [Eubacteriales bacterium]